jgi:hypothetical protein
LAKIKDDDTMYDAMIVYLVPRILMIEEENKAERKKVTSETDREVNPSPSVEFKLLCKLTSATIPATNSMKDSDEPMTFL